MITMSRKRQNLIPYGPVGRLIEDAGASRVSHDAKVSLSNYLENYSEKIANLAKDYAEHRKQSTIKGVDIKLAVKNL